MSGPKYGNRWSSTLVSHEDGETKVLSRVDEF